MWIWKHLLKNKLNYIGYGGFGHQVRDVLHIYDLCELIEIQIKKINYINNKLFTVGGSIKSNISLKKLTEICEKITKNKIQIKRRPKTSIYDIPYFITDNKNVSKVKLPKKNIDIYLKNFEKRIISKINELRINYFDYLLLHNSDDLKIKNGQILLDKILKLKKKKIIKKVGVSIYDPEELPVVYKNFKPDLIQAPLNLLDQRLIRSNFYNIIRINKTKLQVRSIFLQGMLLKSIDDLKKMNINKKLVKKIHNLDLWCKKKRISRLEACVAFIKNLKGIKFITIGFNSDIELKEILKIFKSKKKFNYKQFYLNDKKLIDPRKW